MNTALKIPLSVTEYLEGEQRSATRHEFVNGEVFAMAGESKAHNTIAGNLYITLRTHLRNQQPCRVFMENIKTRVKNAGDERYFYPDLQVSCEPSSLQEHYETAPQLIIEVLSPSTERYDRADKFYSYRKLPSLKEYVLVAQDTPRVEVYRRITDWELELYTDFTAIVRLESVGLELTLAAIYEGIEFPVEEITI